MRIGPTRLICVVLSPAKGGGLHDALFTSLENNSTAQDKLAFGDMKIFHAGDLGIVKGVCPEFKGG